MNRRPTTIGIKVAIVSAHHNYERASARARPVGALATRRHARNVAYRRRKDAYISARRSTVDIATSVLKPPQLLSAPAATAAAAATAAHRSNDDELHRPTRALRSARRRRVGVS